MPARGVEDADARWRDVERVLPTLQQVLVHERHAEEIFATVSTVTIIADRTSAAVRSAGHPPPVLLGDGGPPTVGPTATGPPLGAFDEARWPARAMALPPRWGLLLFTDGLIEGRAAVGVRHRLGLDGLIALLPTRPGDGLAQDPLRCRPADRRCSVATGGAGGRHRRDPARGWPDPRLMRADRLSAGAWLALSAGLLAVATLVAIAPPCSPPII